MQGIAVLLFLSGVLFIYLGWRVESKPSRELYAALVGLSKVKKEVFHLEKNFKTLEEKVDQSQKFREEVNEELNDLKLTFKEKNERNQELNQQLNHELNANQISADYASVANEANVYSLDWIRERGFKQREANSRIIPERVSDKYSKVIELSRRGLTVVEVAEELALSQDAVSMVLRTYQIGGRR